MGEQPLVDRARRLGRKLLTDDRSHERAVMVVGAQAGPSGALAQPLPGLDPVDHVTQHRVRAPQVRDGAVGDGLRAGQGQALGEVGSPSAPPGTPVLVEYFGWIFVSGRMWWTAWATAIAASAKPVAISLSLPSKGVMSPHAQTASRFVLITGSTISAPLEISWPQSFSGPSSVLNPSWSRIASTSTSTSCGSSSEWKSTTRSTWPFPVTSLIW